MKGSGLEEALETVHGPNAVIHNYAFRKGGFEGITWTSLDRDCFSQQVNVDSITTSGREWSGGTHGGNDHGSSSETPTLEMNIGISSVLVRCRKFMICMKEFKANLYQFLILLNQSNPRVEALLMSATW